MFPDFGIDDRILAIVTNEAANIKAACNNIFDELRNQQIKKGKGGQSKIPLII